MTPEWRNSSGNVLGGPLRDSAVVALPARDPQRRFFLSGLCGAGLLAKSRRTTLPPTGIQTVHHYMLESELLHLERIIARSPQKHFPPTYWRSRVEHLENYRQASMYRDRIARLVRLVGELSV
jgi:hypothetical protein